MLYGTSMARTFTILGRFKHSGKERKRIGPPNYAGAICLDILRVVWISAHPIGILCLMGWDSCPMGPRWMLLGGIDAYELSYRMGTLLR